MVAKDRDLVTPEMKTTEVFGHHGVDGVLVASHVTKGDNLGIEPVFLLLNALIVKDMKSKLAILTNAQTLSLRLTSQNLTQVLRQCQSVGVRTLVTLPC